MKKWIRLIACWMPEATNTRSEYVTLIAFPQQQGLRERASVLRYTYIATLVECRMRMVPHGTIRTVNTTHAVALKTTTHPKNSVQKTICCNSTSSAPDDGRMYTKHVVLRIH